jgi:hypothetical protein
MIIIVARNRRKEAIMSKNIGETTIKTIRDFGKQINSTLKTCTSLEEAAQKFVNFLFEEFEESIVLIRLFATIPFGMLPASNQNIVTKLADAEQMTPLIRDDTPVLTLLGSRGGEEIRNCKQYFGIPLTSLEFVQSMPFIANLLKELGYELEWNERQTSLIQERDIETDSIGFLSGVFYVPDAQNAVNAKGEKILLTVDRIAVYNTNALSEVETIFGVGGAYIGDDSFIVIAIFSRETFGEIIVKRFMPIANYFKTATLKLIAEGKLFAS